MAIARSLFFLLLISGSPGYCDENVQPPLLLGIFPHLPPTVINEIFSPLADRISQILGRPVVIHTKTSFNAFSDELKNQHFDIALIQPYDYLVARDQYGYQPLLQRNGKIVPIIVVATDSDINNLSDLAGKKLLLPPEESAISRSLHYLHAAEQNQTRKPKDIGYQHNHFSCMHKVMLAFADACGTEHIPLYLFESIMHAKFRVIHEGDEIPPSVFVAHKRMGSETIEKLKAGLIGFNLNAILMRNMGRFGDDLLSPVDEASYITLSTGSAAYK